MDRFLNTTGKRVRVLREDLGMSQQDLADALNRNGVDVQRTRVSQLERAAHSPPGNMVAALATILGTSGDYLLMLTDDPLPRNNYGGEMLDERTEKMLDLWTALNDQDKAAIIRIAGAFIDASYTVEQNRITSN